MPRQYRKYDLDYPTGEPITVYGYTPNGREVREAKIKGRTYYFVQPSTDNYWLCVGSPIAALKAYAHPELFSY